MVTDRAPPPPRQDLGPTRRCIASGELRPKCELLRFVVGPDGVVVPDLGEQLPGRGLWLSPRRDMIDKACARNLFARAAKVPARAPATLSEQVERLLRRRCLDLLGLARRSGQTVSGYDAVSDWLRAGRAALLVQAADAAEGGRRKLQAQARAAGIPVAEPFSAEELGRALGYEARVHVAVAPGGVADRLAQELARLAGLRGGATEAVAAKPAAAHRGN